MSNAHPAHAPAADSTEEPLPLIVDLGKHSRKNVKRLREGRGKLLDEIATCLEELKGAGKLPDNAQPVVIVVRQKPRRTALWPLA